MPTVAGGFAAMVALAAGILGQVDPFTSMWRALLAFMLGWIGGTVWQVLTTVARQTPGSAPDAASTGEAETS